MNLFLTPSSFYYTLVFILSMSKVKKLATVSDVACIMLTTHVNVITYWQDESMLLKCHCP